MLKTAETVVAADYTRSMKSTTTPKTVGYVYVTPKTQTMTTVACANPTCTRTLKTTLPGIVKYCGKRCSYEMALERGAALTPVEREYVERVGLV
jgi:hypothetical protein